MIQRIVNDIRGALDHDLFFVALNSALTLPDICGKAQYPNESKTGKRYIDWYDNEIGQYEINPNQTSSETMPYLSGAVIYSLRCALLHAGNPKVDNSNLIKRNELPIDHFILKIESKKEYNVYCDSSSVSDIFGQHSRSYTMSVRRICEILCTVAETYYRDNKEKFHFDYEIINWDEVTASLPPVDMKKVFSMLADPMLGKEPSLTGGDVGE